jgi:hypothetical protein
LRSPSTLMVRIAHDRGPYLRTSPPEGAIPARSALIKQSTTKAGDTYYRLSAYADDQRAEPDGSLVPGSYATTSNDVRMAPSGFAAVGRYALPNDRPASNCYRIDAAPGTEVQIGTVAPAYGRAGGGVEVYFPRGVKHVGSGSTATKLLDE